MRILITRSSENQTIGGAELSARDQAIVLDDLGHTPLFMSNSKQIRRELKEKNIATYPSLYLQRFRPPVRYLYFWLFFPLKVVVDLAMTVLLHPDVINPHTREDQISFTVSRFIHRRPVVWKDPGDIIFTLTTPHSAFGNIYKHLYQYAARRADHIYLLNDEHLVLISKHLGGRSQSKLSSIPSSILFDHYHPAPRGKEDSNVVFGSICRLEPTKNISILIDAFKEVKKLHPEVKLFVAGFGSEAKRLYEQAEDIPDVTFTGRYTDISPILNQIDIIVHPALEEGWGRVIKEAMYFGKPIIGARVGGVKKQINDGATGLLFDPTDKQELIDKMLRLVEDPAYRAKLGEEAHRKATEDGDFSLIVKNKILPIYLSVTE